MLDGIGFASDFGKGVGEVVVRLGGAGLDGEDVLELFDGLVHLSPAHQGAAEIVAGAGVVGLFFERLAVMGDGVVGPALA